MKKFNVRFRRFKGAEPVNKHINASGQLSAFKEIQKIEGIEFENILRIDEI